ncbi:MAG TPA: hypothetical protein VM936_11235 [Pyrinomonadaceae bacterium]|nr:hypothetical protein [Pyrinomonadaceae bacterium]
MKRRSLACLLLIVSATLAHATARAQTVRPARTEAAAAESASAAKSHAPVAKKVDEFGRLYGCSGGARLDNFAIELQNEPGSKAYIVARDARGKLPGTAHAWGEYFLQYFNEMRGMEASRFVLVDGASVAGDDLKMELWLVPFGAEPPRVRPPGKDDARPFGGKFVELSVFSDTAFYDTDGSEAGSFHGGILYSAYRDILKKQADSQGYLVVYSPPGAPPGYWRRAGTREQQKISGPGLPPDRLTVINGGALPVKAKPPQGEEEEESYGGVELWVGSRDAPPVKHVEENTALTEALLVGGDGFLYQDKKVAEWLLDNLSDMMRADVRSVGCIVVYPGDGSAVPTGVEGVEEPAPDVFKIAQGWKAELLKKHGFEPNRVVILSGPAEDWARAGSKCGPCPTARRCPTRSRKQGERRAWKRAARNRAAKRGSPRRPPGQKE